MATTYTVHAGVHNCGHNHKSVEAATKCGDKLYASRYVRGSWTAAAKWHGWYILNNSTDQHEPEARG